MWCIHCLRYTFPLARWSHWTISVNDLPDMFRLKLKKDVFAVPSCPCKVRYAFVWMGVFFWKGYGQRVSPWLSVQQRVWLIKGKVCLFTVNVALGPWQETASTPKSTNILPKTMFVLLQVKWTSLYLHFHWSTLVDYAILHLNQLFFFPPWSAERE